MKQDNPGQNRLTLVKTVEETADTKSFFFAHPEPEKNHFKPGQFINIGVNIDGKTYYRAYSISSLPEEEIIKLTIKRVNGGIVSNWMIDHIKEHDQVSTHGIAGVFNIVDHPPGKNVVFISAGCGITPVMSMARHLLALQKDPPESIQFIHRARNADHIIYNDEIIALAGKHAHFQPVFYLTDASGTDDASIYRSGTLSAPLLKTHLQDKENVSVYLCGPAGFMEMVEKLLREIDFDLAHLFQEDFSPVHQKASCADDALSLDEADNEQAKSSYNVSVPDFDVSKEVEKGENLLTVLQDENIPIIAACYYGLCGSCKCKVESGKVELTTDPVANGVLTQAELDQGYTLACSSLIVDNVKISLK